MKSKKLPLFILSILTLVLVLLAYQHSYDNEFHFDDSHTIQDNPYIRDIGNLPLFFTDGAETFSSLPANQVYRPIVTSSIAFDYWLSSKLSDSNTGFDTHYYHYSMMLTYLLMLVLLYFFFLKLFQQAHPHQWNSYFALFATAFFGLHTVNAETLNYIISRSDLLSTFFVIAAFDVYLYFPKVRKWGLFLIPFALGVLTKLTAAMFIPLLMVYYLFYEFFPLEKSAQKTMLKKLLIYGAVFILMLMVSVVFVIGMQSDTFVPSNHSRWDYLITMPFVILHYFISFFVPYNLSADTDWTILGTIWHWKFFVGMAFIGALLWLVFTLRKQKKWAPVSFGILWFFIALAPTSSLIPLSEVLNDHRMFYPFVGLMLAVVYSLSVLLLKYQSKIKESIILKSSIVGVIVLVLAAHFYGVRQRTEVWDNGKSLWYDVTVKSPQNGRGLMNYGLRLMGEGDYTGAMEYYTKALEFSPSYSYLYTNIAICYHAMGQNTLAEENFAKALQFGYYSHKTHYYYGDFLLKNKRYQEAAKSFNISLEMAPRYIFSMYKLMEIHAQLENWDSLKEMVKQAQAILPSDPTATYYLQISDGKLTKLQQARKQTIDLPSANAFLELSLQFYNASKFDSCVWAAQKAVEFDSLMITAYNNMCAANNVLYRWNDAIAAGEKALQINPNNQLAKNNLAVSYHRKAMEAELKNLNTANELIELSLKFYQEQMYEYCIRACEKALKIDSKNVLAMNNICTSYNAMGDFEKAIAIGEKAVKMAPDYQLAKNNLAVARQGLAKANSK